MNALAHILQNLDEILNTIPASMCGGGARALTETRALRFHATRKPTDRPVVVLLGGTGTGKSTIVNRILQREISAASFRRTFTSGVVAVTRDGAIPPNWLDLPTEPIAPSQWPVRGQADKLMLVQSELDILNHCTLVDTPDLDGDNPVNHAQADRAFRFADAVIFLVSPEKYQMNELLPYYRLAERYGVGALFVMNKCETPEQLHDYRSMLPSGASVFAVPRDDSAYITPSGLGELQKQLANLKFQSAEDQPAGLINRRDDLVGRLMDHVISPLENSRKQVDARIAALSALVATPAEVDVNPLTQQLQRRMREKSVLYLIGPQRVLDRVRQLPGLLARLPRTTWDLVTAGKLPEPAAGQQGRSVPDFRAMSVDQFRILQSRIEEIVAPTDVRVSLIDPEQAGLIVDDELRQLNQWLSDRWDRTPRDTAIIQRFLKILPGAEKLTRLSETAPYLLTVIVATHHVMFGHVDLAILGTWSLVTWLGERISNEVSNRTRETNRNIAARFQQLAGEQIRRVCQTLHACTATTDVIGRLKSLTDQLAETEVSR